MDPSANAFHAISSHLPERILQGLKSTPVDELALDNLVRLISGAEPSPHSTPDIREQWSGRQTSITALLSPLFRSDNKRSLEDSDLDSASKRPRLSPSELPTNQRPDDAVNGRLIYTLSPISVSSPVRKKVDLNILENALVLLNSTTKAFDAPPIPISVFRRAFLLPTRGKTKAHWTVVILSSDSQPQTTRGKQAKSANDEQPQIIFGVDAKLAAALSSTTYDAEAIPTTTTHTKNSETYPILRQFLDHFRIPIFEPTPNNFKSAVPGLGKSANPDGVPGVEAYRAAKPGTLWFMPEGILWGESKPCEFWAAENLIGKSEGLKIIGGIGKTCSVILTRRSHPIPQNNGTGDKNTQEGINGGEEPEEDVGEETEFSMVDSKEKEGIEKWTKRHQHLFGTAGGRISVEEPSKAEKKAISQGPLTIHQFGEASDSSDEDFTVSSDEDSSAEADSENSGEDGEGEDGEQEEEEEEGGADSGKSGVGESEEELDPKNHPLLRAGGLPRMSKAAMDMAVSMVMDDMVGSSDDEEVDELMD